MHAAAGFRPSPIPRLWESISPDPVPELPPVGFLGQYDSAHPEAQSGGGWIEFVKQVFMPCMAQTRSRADGGDDRACDDEGQAKRNPSTGALPGRLDAPALAPARAVSADRSRTGKIDGRNN